MRTLRYGLIALALLLLSIIACNSTGGPSPAILTLQATLAGTGPPPTGETVTPATTEATASITPPATGSETNTPVGTATLEGTGSPGPESTPTPPPTRTPTASPSPTAPTSPTPSQEFGNNLAPVIDGRASQVITLRDPLIDYPNAPLYSQWLPTGYEMFYAAETYYCMRVDVNGDGQSDGIAKPCETPFNNIIGGDTEARLWRPEYTNLPNYWRCPPKDGILPTQCDPSAHLFCDSAPCETGWQTKITLPVSAQARECTAEGEFYIWSPDPDWSSESRDWGTSGAMTPDATEDDKRSVDLYITASDNWVFRENDWIATAPLGYPQVSLSQMPYDGWKPLTLNFSIPAGETNLVVGWGMKARWGWPNNLYLRNTDVRCKGVATGPEPTSTPPPTVTPGGPFPTPTQIGSGPMPTPNVTIGCTSYPCGPHTAKNPIYRVVSDGLNIRTDFSTAGTVVGSYAQGAEIRLQCIIDVSPNSQWGSTQPCDPLPNRWFILYSGNVDYAIPLEGPEG